MVPQNVIEELRMRMDLVSVVEQVTPVKRSGTSHTACCPFHDEKTPSFHISQSKGLFHCFGCGVGGNLYHFLMKYHHFDFPDALEFVARELGFDLSPYKNKGVSKDTHAPLYKVLDYAKGKFHHYLTKHAKGKGAISYLTKRGISPEAIVSYGMGLVPDGWDHLTKALKRDGHHLGDAMKAGLIGQKKSNKDEHFDVFRNRLLIPIEDAKGRIIGFGGRSLGDEQPKYINSPQTPLFDKSKVLFGLSRAEKAIRQKKNVYIVEGYFDQIALSEYGIENVVATMGTAMTAYHCNIIKRYAPRITLVFDGDQAGINACKKAGRSVLAQGIDTDVIVMQEGEDPDTYIRKNNAASFEVLEKTPLLDFLIKHFYTDVDEISKKTQFLQEMVEVVLDAKNQYIAKVLKDQLCDKMDLDPSIFKEKPKFAPPSASREPEAPPVMEDLLTKESVLALVTYAQSQQIQEVMGLEDLLTFLMNDELASYGRRCLTDEKVKSEPSKWIDHWTKPAYKAMLTQVLVSMEMHMQGIANEKIWDDCFSKLKKQYVGKLVQDIEKAEHAGQTELVESLSKQMFEMKKFRSSVTG